MKKEDTQFRLVGGRLCLDFVNTADWSAEGAVIEDKRNNINDIISWRAAVELHNILIPDHRSFRDKVLQLRMNLRQILVSLINAEQPAPGLLAEFNNNFRTSSAVSLAKGPKGSLQYGPETSLAKAIEISAAAVLSNPSEIGRVKICPGDNCGWLFLDESKNRRRQWCAMDMCGNRAKAKRFYYRHLKT